MALPLSCCSPCTTPEVTETPGSPGLSSVAITTATFAIPAIGAQVAVSVQNNQMLGVGLPVFATDGNIWGTFQVFAVPRGSSTSVVLEFLGSAIDSPVGSAILTGAKIIPAGIGQVFPNPLTLLLGGTGASVATYKLLRAAIFEAAFAALTNFTDNTGGAVSSTLAAGVGIQTLSFYTRLQDISANVLAVFTPGYLFKILNVLFVPNVAATTAGKTATLGLQITGVGVTNGQITLTSANCTPVGTTISTVPTGANTSSLVTDTISVVGTLPGAVPFIEGSGHLIVRIQNMDTANAVASLAAKVNTLQTGVS